jgi:caffeoyl-CoA O-methyltransferase
MHIISPMDRTEAPMSDLAHKHCVPCRGDAPALETLAGLPDASVDFVFVDADKESYPRHYQEGLRLLRPGGLLVADNALWRGEVLAPADADGRAIARFNEVVRTDERVEKVLLTVRDGVYLVRRR